MMKGLGDMSPDGRTDGRTQRRLYAPPKFFGEHKTVRHAISSTSDQFFQINPVNSGWIGKYYLSFISSPEPKVQVSYSDRLLSVVCLSVNFSHFRLLLQNHWTKLGTNYPLVKRIQVNSNKGPGPLQRG